MGFLATKAAFIASAAAVTTLGWRSPVRACAHVPAVRASPRLVATHPGRGQPAGGVPAGGGGDDIDGGGARRRAPLPASSREKAQSKHRLITLFRRAREAQQCGSTSLARSLLERCLVLDASDSHALLALARRGA